MELLSYFLASILSFSALFLGFSLALAAKEELKPGKKYFVLSQNIILALILVFLLYFKKVSLILSIIIVIAVLLSLFYFDKIKNKYTIYPLLGIIFYLSSKNINLFVIESALIFLYGLPTGTLLTNIKNKKQAIKNILHHISFIIIALALFYLI
ncbi:hypothetical protein J4209_04685 [Candidatus Woesearchaeota archaeon]|nr:hypothetical protein [Candidatus Woesearchaeota archaeon]